MRDMAVDLDLLATHLRNALNQNELSIRAAARKIGCSPATLTRLLQGSKSKNIPDAINLIRASSWLGKGLSDFESTNTPKTTTLADVEVHLRALPGLNKADAEALIAMVKAGYDSAKKQRSKKGS